MLLVYKVRSTNTLSIACVTLPLTAACVRHLH